MLNRVSNWQVGQWLDQIRSEQSYMGLVQSDPTEADIASVEVYGDGYRRQLVSWRKSGRTLLLDNTLSWTGIDLPMGIAGVAVFNSQFGTRMRASGLFEEKITLITATSFTLGPGEVALHVA